MDKDELNVQINNDFNKFISKDCILDNLLKSQSRKFILTGLMCIEFRRLEKLRIEIIWLIGKSLMNWKEFNL